MSDEDIRHRLQEIAAELWARKNLDRQHAMVRQSVDGALLWLSRAGPPPIPPPAPLTPESA